MSFWSVGLQVRLVEGPGKGRTFPLDAAEMTVGRARTAGDRAPGWVLIYDDTVSRIQCDLRWEDDKEAYILINRSDTNPTKVNDVVVSDVTLKPGDQIRMGNSVLDLQQADFRFGGMKPPAARPGRPAPSSVAIPRPQDPALAFRNPSHDMEASKSTKKASRIVALTTRPKLQLACLSGSEQGQIWPITGMSLALGGSLAEADENEEKKEKSFDQELTSKNADFPPRSLHLVWRELENAFELSRLDAGLTLAVTLERHVDGTEWIAELPAGGAVMFRQKDILWVGDSPFQLSAVEED